MHANERLLRAIAGLDSALLEQQRQMMNLRKVLGDLDQYMTSIERGAHALAATLGRVQREVERLGNEARTLQRIMTAAERGQAPAALGDKMKDRRTSAFHLRLV